ncbi:MAG: DUF3293 domain-containing protein [Planctomycetota bacterium]
METSLEDTVLEPALLQAYRETHYEVGPPHAMTLRVGESSGPLAALMAAAGVQGAAFVTAANPLSQPLGWEENEALLASLRAALAAEGWVVHGGRGRHPGGGWDPEPSLLVLGLDREEAVLLGHRWRQNAVVWAGDDAVPRLLLLR